MKTNKQPIILIWGMVAGAAAGGIIDGINADRQQDAIDTNRQENMRNEKEMAQLNYNLGMKRWHQTNYGAQMKELEKAGLNAGLMYGTAGQGGQSTVGQASAKGGENITPTSGAIQGMGIGLQAQQTKAQIDLLKAQTEKTTTEAKKIGGVDTEEAQSRIGKLAEETTNEVAKGKLLEIERKIGNIRELYSDREISANVNIIEQELYQMQRDNLIGDRTMYDVIDEIKARSAGQIILNDLNSARIRLTEAQENQIYEAIQQKWNEISLYDTEVNIKIAQTILNGIGTVGGLMQAGKLAEAMRKGKQSLDKEWAKGFEEGTGHWKR